MVRPAFRLTENNVRRRDCHLQPARWDAAGNRGWPRPGQLLALTPFTTRLDHSLELGGTELETHNPTAHSTADHRLELRPPNTLSSRTSFGNSASSAVVATSGTLAAATSPEQAAGDPLDGVPTWSTGAWSILDGAIGEPRIVCCRPYASSLVKAAGRPVSGSPRRAGMPRLTISRSWKAESRLQTAEYLTARDRRSGAGQLARRSGMGLACQGGDKQGDVTIGLRLCQGWRGLVCLRLSRGRRWLEPLTKRVGEQPEEEINVLHGLCCHPLAAGRVENGA